jgi:hypothetical protein
MVEKPRFAISFAADITNLFDGPRGSRPTNTAQVSSHVLALFKQHGDPVDDLRPNWERIRRRDSTLCPNATKVNRAG